MNVQEKSAPVRDRILATACDLFYRQGYRATGINQVIAESGVAKASFYAHFPSKDDLLLEYARVTSARELGDLKREVLALPTPRARFFGPLDILPPWFESSAYRGCPFQIAMAEAPPEADALRAIVRAHEDGNRAFLRRLAEDLRDAERALRDLDCAALADTYLVLFDGAIAASVAYRSTWPVDRARATLARWVGPGD